MRCPGPLAVALLLLPRPGGAAEPNDSHYRALQWNLRAIGLEQAWEVTEGSADVVVAVIDSGVALHHPDLAARFLPGRDFISDPALSGDGDGWDDDPTDVGANPEERVYHGSHVAGIIGAASNNSRGVAGVDWRCRILPVRAISSITNDGTDADLAAAIRWAAGLPVPGAPTNPNPADVINLSFGGPGRSAVLEDAVTAALAQGVVVIAAAGNQGKDVRSFYPAAIPGVITVGATDYSGALASYSNYGAQVDVMAPGGDVAVSLPGEYLGKTWEAGILSTSYYHAKQAYSYRMFDGTSVAAPQVTGVVSLVLALRPDFTLENIHALLRGTGVPVEGCSTGCGAGLVDARAAVELAQNPGALPGGEELFQGGCQVGAGTGAGTPAAALVLVVAVLLGLARRAGALLGLLLALLAAAPACTGEMGTVDERVDGSPPLVAQPLGDGGPSGTDSVLWSPGELCSDECSAGTVCAAGVCRKECDQPTPGCNAPVKACGADETCLQVSVTDYACLPAQAQEGDACGGNVLCAGGLLCLVVDDQAARCVKLCVKGQCGAGEICETTSAKCEVCLPE
jgi:hypothetical protein